MPEMHDSTMDYLKPTDAQLEQMNKVREQYKAMLTLLGELPDGRYKALAITKLEASAMWANKSITRNSDGSPRS